MLRIQQYEGLLKALLLANEVVGDAASLSASHAKREDWLSRQTLGNLVGELFDSLVVPEGFERELLPDATTPTDRVSMAFRLRMEMPAERQERTKAALKELVALRNNLVHHFLELFDIGTAEGCVVAAQHLESSYQVVDGHLLELVDWARSLENARAMAAQLLQSPMVTDMVINGIAPDGSFEWADAGIVRVLREAHRQFSEDGWTRLERARAWILGQHPAQTPDKYGCVSWPQVLSESRRFDLEYRGEHAHPRVAWYQPRK